MTAIQAYEAVLIELNKVKAPSLSITDFCYLFNKSIQQYVNLIYNSYEVNQQKVDDIRVLRGSVQLNLNQVQGNNFLSNGVWETYLPDDYLHILNCVVAFKKNSDDIKCDKDKKLLYIGAKRLTSDANPQVITNYYLKPSHRNPYYYINNVNGQDDTVIKSIPNLEQIDGNATTYKATISFTRATLTFTDVKTPTTKYRIPVKDVFYSGVQSILPLYRKLLKVKNQEIDINPVFRNLKLTLIDDTSLEISLLGYTIDELQPDSSTNYLVDRESQTRYGNATRARMEIRLGDDDKYAPQFVSVDYIKSPQIVSINEDLLDDIEDNSQILEFPDYVIYEIINQMVKLVLENTSNPRVQTMPVVNTSIAPSTGAVSSK